MKLANKLDLSFILNNQSEIEKLDQQRFVGIFQPDFATKRNLTQMMDNSLGNKEENTLPPKKKQRTSNVLEHLTQSQKSVSTTIQSHSLASFPLKEPHFLPHFSQTYQDRVYASTDKSSTVHSGDSAFSPVKRPLTTEPLANENRALLQSITKNHAQTNSPTFSCSSEEESEQTTSRTSSPNDTEIIQVSDYTLLEPIQRLANYFGFATSSNRSWRYRDVKRSLLENRIPAFHKKLIDTNPEHWILKERLPHKISYVNFAKRIKLLVYHFVVRDGNIPNFYAKLTQQKQQELDQIIQVHDANFATKFCFKNAFQVHGKLLTLHAQQIQATTEMLNQIIQECTNIL